MWPPVWRNNIGLLLLCEGQRECYKRDSEVDKNASENWLLMRGAAPSQVRGGSISGVLYGWALSLPRLVRFSAGYRTWLKERFIFASKVCAPSAAPAQQGASVALGQCLYVISIGTSEFRYCEDQRKVSQPLNRFGIFPTLNDTWFRNLVLNLFGTQSVLY